ncbi:MAG TPA: hypothetical protein VMU90_08785, partial [Solirubrobacteraceae bacterium]|nr:hypothetical protein [Solirubrobacteraceae bacterium]
TPQGHESDAQVRRWTPGAEAGDAVAMLALSAAYAMKQDWEAAELWAQRLLDGDPDGDLSWVAMRALAQIREERGDRAGAQEWNRRADEAQSRMPAGLDFVRLVAPITERFGDVPDPERLRAAAQAGDVVAMTALGLQLLTEDDPQQAVQWLTPGAEAGDTLAMFLLSGALTAQGDEQGAGRWLERAAEGSGESMLMGLFGVFAARTGDHEKARYWKDKAQQAMAEEDETGPDT